MTKRNILVLSASAVSLAFLAAAVVLPTTSTAVGQEATTASCELATTTITGDTILGAGCAVLTIQSGAVITIVGARRVEVAAARVVVAGGGAATVRANGVEGLPGDRGGDGDGYPTPWIAGSDGEYWRARRDAESSSANPCRGRAGGRGRPGTPGAEVRLATGIAVEGTLTIESTGGPGGPGGDGGPGNTLRNPRNYYCDGCTYTCLSNGAGAVGEPGTPGTIFVGSERRATGRLTLTSSTP